MRRLFPVILIPLLIAVLPANAASMEDATERLSAINTLKNEIASAGGGAVFSDEEAEAIDLLYEVLEGEEYTASSLDGDIGFSVGEYDLETTRWKAEVRGVLFDKINFTYDTDILYSDAMNKTYVPESEMTDYQRRDYEFYIDDYETRREAGETVFFAELTFHLTHWEGPDEYRLEGVTLRIYKEPDRPREILSFDMQGFKGLFTWPAESGGEEPRKDFRSPEQIERNRQRVSSILASEEASRTEAEEAVAPARESREWEQIPRRAFYIAFDIRPDMLSSMNQQVIGYTYGSLTFGIGRFFFAGVNMGIDLGRIQNGAIYSFGAAFGANVTIANMLRPYLEADIGVITSNKSLVKLGGGLDIIIAHLMITVGANYNWENNFNGDTSGSAHYPRIFLGAGISW